MAYLFSERTTQRSRVRVGCGLTREVGIGQALHGDVGYIPGVVYRSRGDPGVLGGQALRTHVRSSC